ncbi:MAG: hypothetical protein JO004_07160 [Methylobacteriaceae bacterium]|nr:hypothetical protein [Methylobacteriaceae bacterium]
MSKEPSRRAVLAGPPAIAAATVLASSAVTNAVSIGIEKAAERDRIFAAIEAHRAAVLALNAADDGYRNMSASVPGYEAASRASTEASEAEIDALRNVLACRPTTVEGVLALLDHLGQPEFSS